MNVHHLELFYYVAKHGGISAAVRRMPYGIQQPAVSGQIGNLEREIGTKLFERSPFRLTPAGEKLYAHVAPFFDNLGTVAASVRAESKPELRVAGAELILRDHLPGVLTRLKEKFPGLRLSLRTMGFQSEVQTWLREGAIDVAFAPIGAKLPAPLRHLAMAKFPLVLEVPAKWPVKSAAELWARKKITEPLIGLHEASVISQAFQKELKQRGLSWPQTIEATSLDLVTRYVANGDGIGVSVRIGPAARKSGVRVLALDDFPPVSIGAVWRGELSATTSAMLKAVQAYARQRWPEWAMGEGAGSYGDGDARAGADRT